AVSRPGASGPRVHRAPSSAGRHDQPSTVPTGSIVRAPAPRRPEVSSDTPRGSLIVATTSPLGPAPTLRSRTPMIPGLARTSEPSGSMLATRRARFGVPDAGTFAGGVPASGTSASPDSSGTPRVLVPARDAGGAEGLGDAGGVGRPGVGPDVTGSGVRATGGGPTATRPVGRSAETRMNAAAVITATAKAVPARAKRCLRITPAAHRSGPGSGSGVGVTRRTALGRGARVRAATAAQDAV